ncbi:TetR/AcrR family transcriptional regulator [Rothia sp. AR01]|uniref:TetR/AcrR family transcriptional regulator n=1 Tax=Rothia santali TaxID=2949643 RepID=A0A9X2HB07_9MICC|nr:ScbR family autoregulator-binding transcription factor [Rothia santali]MCP3424835.1 TetR/AcrR family transcriptional regulator [Rothia santali]
MTQREQQRLRTRAAILRIAAEEFERRGYAATALSEIAGRLGVTKGTVYFHFPTKSAVALAVVDSYFARWRELLEEIERRGLTGVGALRWLSAEVAASYREDPGTRAPLRLMREAEVVDTDLPTPFLPWIEVATRHVRQAQERGEMRRELDAGQAAWQIVAGFFGVEEVSWQLTRGSDLVERVEAMWDLLLPGLAGPAGN